MRLFHVSEEPNIAVFEPRLPTRKDLDPNVGLIWAIDEQRLANFLTPRNCPRVTYHVKAATTAQDRQRFFTSPTMRHAVVIESGWYKPMMQATLYLYEFDPKDFVLQDDAAGYYVATKPQIPIKRHVVTDLFGELIARNVELRIVDDLWSIAEAVQTSTLNWSLCRMAFAKRRGEEKA